MKLPDNSIGISDILAWRDCPRRMSFSMRRHMPEGEPPEAAIEHAYGSCIHDILSAIEEGDLTDEQAVQVGFDKWAWALEPDDLDVIKEDIETYHERDFVGVRTIANEGEFRVPLLEHGGETIYFRFRLDRLYQRLDNAGLFIHIDFKSSKWRRTEEEVHKDLQLWAYNWGIHEYFPEVESLIQRYDQLRYGSIPTRKSPAQRAKMEEWLKRNVTAILNDDDYKEDDLLAPQFNQWCPWCPIKESCPVIEQLSDFAISKISALAPDPEVLGSVAVDATPIEGYVEKLETVSSAIKVLEAYEEQVKGLVRRLPNSEQERLGYRLSPRRSDNWDETAMRAAHDILGEDFYAATAFTKRRLEQLLADDPRLEQVLGLARKEVSGDTLRRRG